MALSPSIIERVSFINWPAKPMTNRQRIQRWRHMLRCTSTEERMKPMYSNTREEANRKV